MLDAVVAGFSALLSGHALLFIALGCVYGIMIGLTPGLGGIVALALLLPFTYGFDIVSTLSLLLSAHIATIWGSSVTGILFRVPGAARLW
jgi:putative tricarboxylic transport membrane protein